jgi:hypothetical protein
MPGVYRVPIATPTRTLVAASLAAGYAHTESVLGRDDRHHRALASVALSVRPLRWLSVALRFDGRYDHHRVDDSIDDGYVGDPRIVLRAAGRLGSLVGLGGQVALWAPGARAPSLVPSAFTVDAQLFGGYVPEHGRVAFVGRVGFRFDQSANAAPDAAMLSASDRLSLGLSAYHSALFGIAAAARAGIFEPFGECTLDILVGSGAPVASSPLHLVAGLRVHPLRSWHLHPGLLIDVSPSARASLAPADPLVPNEPRVAVMLTLGVGFPRVARVETAQRARPTEAGAPQSHAPRLGIAEGDVRDPQGNPVSGATVLLRRGDETVREIQTDAEGRWRVERVALGEYTVVVRSSSGAERSATLVVSAATAGTPRSTITIESVAEASAQLRGTVRSFSGSGVRSTIRIVELNRTITTGADGTFRIAVEPRTYTVEFSAEGYQSQRRRVTVTQGGVVILNVDLRPRRGGP